MTASPSRPCRPTTPRASAASSPPTCTGRAATSGASSASRWWPSHSSTARARCIAASRRTTCSRPPSAGSGAVGIISEVVVQGVDRFDVEAEDRAVEPVVRRAEPRPPPGGERPPQPVPVPVQRQVPDQHLEPHHREAVGRGPVPGVPEHLRRRPPDGMGRQPPRLHQASPGSLLDQPQPEARVPTWCWRATRPSTGRSTTCTRSSSSPCRSRTRSPPAGAFSTSTRACTAAAVSRTRSSRCASLRRATTDPHRRRQGSPLHLDRSALQRLPRLRGLLRGRRGG